MTLPWELTLAAVSAPVAALPVVLIVVDPAILDAPLIVAPFKVLFVSVSVASCVTTTPDTGNVAVELIPVPPLEGESCQVVILPASKLGMSPALSESPATTWP